jgi:hypothetical protein
MAITEFETEALANANELIDSFGQYIAILNRSESLVDVAKPWLGKTKSYYATVVKGVAKTIDENLLNMNDSRTQNINREFLVAGDKLTSIDSNDLLITFNALVSSNISIPSFNISTDSTVTQTGVYNVDSTSGNIVLTLDENNADGTVILISKTSIDTNTITLNTQGAVTIESNTSYNISYNYDVTGFILNNGNYQILERYKVYEPMIVSPAGNNILYKLRVGA